LDFDGEDTSSSAGATPAAALKREVSERLAAHRSRRGSQLRPQANPVPIDPPNAARPQRANRIATAVAERYAQTQSYREFLAAEAARALEEANAKAEIAARNAQAMAAAQQQLLAEIDLWPEPEPTPPGAPAFASETWEFLPQAIQHPRAQLRVRLHEDAGVLPPQTRADIRVNPPAPVEPRITDDEILALDDEIAFRQAPTFPPPASPPVAIPANLLEFPRQLVAPRKARPRVAEGPLRDDAETAPEAAQLRIFEVDANQIATSPDRAVASDLPGWASIRLDAMPAADSVYAAAAPYADAETSLGPSPASHTEAAAPDPAAQPDLAATLPFATASLAQRAMAAIVDACILGFTFLAVAAGFARFVPVLPAAPIAGAAAAATLLALFILYQMLFFTFACATPGMRYARIGLCTFGDENPTRAEMRRRTWALLLSACPLGLGFLWALLDEDRLGWHDRISRMYQRGY
jgi:uncharacterized RDD family membrane protein YckC